MGMFDLPAPLLVGLLADWLSVTSLLHLDSACCSSASRKPYLELVGSNEFCLQTVLKHGDSYSGGVFWFISRKAKAKRLHIAGTLSVDNSRALSTFIFNSGAWLESIQFGGSKDATISEIILQSTTSQFSRLRILVMDGCGRGMDGVNLGSVLVACAQSLKRLKLENCYLNTLVTAPQLPNLEVLHVYMSSIAMRDLCQLVSASFNLRSFYCNDLLGSDDCLEALAAHCPLLQVLYYELANYSSVSSLARLLKACTALEVVDIGTDSSSYDRSPRDHQVALILEHCVRLKAFGAPGRRFHITSDAVRLAVATRARDLMHLCWYDCDFVDDAPILTLAENCGNLRSLDLSLCNSHVSQTALTTLVSKLSSVVELALHHCRLSDDVLRAMAAHCPRLEALHLACSKHHTEVGIAAVAQGCTALRVVYIKEHDGVITLLSRLLWRALRPDVVFVFRDHLSAMWMALEDVEREELVVW